MIRNSITTKVFVLIAISFAIIFLVTTISPLYFFEGFYFTRRIEDIKNEMLSFADEQFTEETDEASLNQAMYDFDEANNAQIDIINLNSLDKSYNFNYTYRLKNERYGFVNLYFNKLTTYSTEFHKAFDAQVGDKVYITGYFIDDYTFCPIQIDNYKIDKDIYEINNLYFLTIYEVYMIGEITQINPPPMEPGTLYKSQLLWEQYDIYRKDGFELVEDEVKLYEYIDNETGLVNYGLLTIKNDFLIATIITEQSVTEYVRYMSEYQQYFVLASFMVLVILALLLTRFIVRPLINLNNSALQMVTLDFSQPIRTDRKDEIGQLAVSLNSLSNSLESTIGDLHSANEKLSVELESEKALEEMRKVFIADTSHELKTPLGIVRGYTERIQDKLLDDQVDKDYLVSLTSIVLDEMRKMDRLILNMNELSKLESMSYHLDNQELDIEVMISSLVDAFSILSEEKDLVIHTKLEQQLPYIKGDRHRLEQVFSNLMSNAIRYSKEGANIYVSLKLVQNDIVFHIENEYDDLEAIDLDRLWQRFYRVDKSRSRELGGSGLGLSIVKIILELHDFSYRAYKTESCLGFEVSIKA